MANNIQTTVKSWSSTYSSNQPDGSDAFSSLPDDLRAIQAAVRLQHESEGWRDLGHTPTRTANTTFTIPTDVTAYYVAYTPIRCTDSSTLYGEIASSSYSGGTGLTTVTVTLDSGNLSASLSAVALGVLNTNGMVRRAATQSPGDNSTKIATTAYADAIGGLTAASQAQQEAAASTTVGVTPGRQQYHPSAAKAWVEASVSGSVVAGYNVSSVTDSGVGECLITLTNAFSSTTVSAAVASARTTTGANLIAALDTGSAAITVFTKNASGVATDPSSFMMVAFGDLE